MTVESLLTNGSSSIGAVDGFNWSGSLVAQLGLLVLCSVLGTLANALVFAVFYRRPSLRTISNRFVLSLILANCTSAAVSIPGYIYQLIRDHYNEEDISSKNNIGWSWDRQGLDGLTVTVSLASVLSILLISLDRYYAVNSPLHYSTIVTRQRSMAMISFVWMTSFIMSIPVLVGLVRLDDVQPHNNETFLLLPPTPYEDQEDQQYWMNLSYSVALILFGFAWPLCALCWLYLRMYEAALKNSARTRRQSLCSNQPMNHNHPHRATPQRSSSNNNGAAGVLEEQQADEYVSGNVTPNPGSDPTAPPLPPAVDDDETQFRLLAAAAAVNSASDRIGSSNRIRCWPGPRMASSAGMTTNIQQQVLTLLWREEGRAMRTTAMVVMSFTSCWLPFFVWLLPFQLLADNEEDFSMGIFLARLAAFSNVLISPAIYVYRNQVAQKEAARLLRQILTCQLGSRMNTNGGPHDPMNGIAAPLVLGGAGLTHPTVGGLSSRATTMSSQSNSSGSTGQLTVNMTPYSRRSSSLAVDSSIRIADPIVPSVVICPSTSPAAEETVSWAPKQTRSGSVDTGRSLLPAPSGARPKRSSISGPSPSESERNRRVLSRSPLLTSNRRPSTSGSRRPTQPTIYQSESVLQVILPVTYPSLDFFDTGLEEHCYGQQPQPDPPTQTRVSSSSFSRFIQRRPSNNSTNRRTYSLSRVLSSSNKRWPASMFRAGNNSSNTPSTIITAV